MDMLSKVIALAVLIVLTAGMSCGDNNIDMDSSDAHGCTVENVNGLWYNENLTLHHSDSRFCPVDVAQGTDVSGGGRVEDRGLTYPDDIGEEDSARLWLDVYNKYSTCADNSENVLQSGSTNSFGWSDFDADGTYEWTAVGYANWETGTGWDSGRDCPMFTIEYVHTLDTAVIWTMVDYFDQQF